MQRFPSVLKLFGLILLLAALPLAVVAQESDGQSSSQAESVIADVTDEVVEDPTTADASDPEQDSPFVEAAKEPGVALADLEQLLVPLTAAELAGLADVWQRNLQTAIEHAITLNLSLQDLSEDEANKVREEIVEATDQRTILQDKYNAVLDAWARKGGAEEELKPHTDYLSAMTADVVKTTDWGTLLRLAQQWLISTDGGLGLLVKAITLIVALWLMRFPAMLLRRIARRALDKVPDVSELLKRFVLNVVYYATFGIGIMMMLAAFGVSVGPMLTLLGGASFVLAFAMQDSLSNIASGLMMMVLKPFDVGDMVEAAGVSGIVDDMNLVSTQIRTFDNQYIIVPNSKIWNEVITNVNIADTRRIDMVFGVGYDADLEQAKAILMELATSHDKVLSDPEPQVYISALGDSAVMINCRPWGNTEDYWTIYWDILEQAKYRFDTAGISIPFPQQDVHIITAPALPAEPQTPPDSSNTPSTPVGDEGDAGDDAR